MTPSEYVFKAAVKHLIAVGTYPSPGAIQRLLKPQDPPSHNLNGRQCRWREEVFEELGWTRAPMITKTFKTRWGETLSYETFPQRRWQPPV